MKEMIQILPCQTTGLKFFFFWGGDFFGGGGGTDVSIHSTVRNTRISE